MRACKCPNCGANLKADDDREFMFCEFCGARIDLVDRRTVHTEHIIDEAKIKDAEAKIKNAENVSRIVNIFAAPVEEKQRQAEFERQRQLEAERQEYERKKRKEAEQKENREAMEDGCAAAMGGCLVQCVKHPLIACVILFLILASCMGSASSSSSSKASPSSRISNSIASNTSEWSSDSCLATKEYDYDIAYTRISADDSNIRYYYLISYSDNVVTFVSSKTNTAIIASILSGDLSSGLKIRWCVHTSATTYEPLDRTLQYANSSSDAEILSTDDDGSFPFVKASVSAAEKALYQSDKIYDYSS